LGSLLGLRLKKETALALIVGFCQGILSMRGTALPNKSAQGVISGVVISEPRYPKGELITFTIRARTPQELAGKSFECRGAILPWLESSHLGAGSEVVIRGNSSPFSDKPWSYDWYRRINGSSGECKIKQLAQVTAPPSWIANKRQLLKDVVRQAVGDNERAGLLLSTAFGFRDQLSLSTEEIFRRAGLSHVLVASGYQVGMIFLIVFFLIRKLAVKHVALAHSRLIRGFRWLAPGIAAIFYTALIGAESSAIRATIAVILQLLARAHSTSATSLGTLAASLFILSLTAPGTILSPGTQLTYGALLGILLGSSLVQSRSASTVLVAIAAGSFTGAISILWFKQFSIIGPITNIILAPIISVVAVNGSLIALACKLVIPSLGDILLRALADCLIGLLEITDYLVPSWALIEFETDDKIPLLSAAGLTLLPAAVMLALWVRRNLALFDGVILRGKERETKCPA
jgi:ComEC/Rec2-related protein